MIYSEPMTDQKRFLLLALRGLRTADQEKELVRLFSELGPATCRHLAKENKAEALVGSCLSSVIPLGDHDRSWTEMLAENARRVERLFSHAARISERLRAAGCRNAAVESAGILADSGQPFSALCSGDVDILVDPERRERVEATMQAEGFVVRSRRGYRAPMDEYTLPCDDDQPIWINIYYQPFHRIWTPLPYRDRNPIWLARTIPSRRVPDLHVLAPADALAHVAMHTSFHSYVRTPGVRLQADADWLVREHEIDWRAFLGEIRAMDIPTRAFATLSMAAGLLETPIPGEVLSDLYPGDRRWFALKSLISRAGCTGLDRRKFGKIESTLIDALLDERGVNAWASSTLFPSSDWMRDFFLGDAEWQEAPIWRKHLERFRRLLTRWEPN